ncbi:kinase-like domain-containing protein [Haematococcus lacustris]
MRVLVACSGSSLAVREAISQASSISELVEVQRPLSFNPECSVSVARCKVSGQSIVVKSYIVHSSSRVAREQVETEVEVTSGLDGQQHAVPLLYAAEDSRGIHLVMQLADGGDVRQLLPCLGECQLRDTVVRPLLEVLAVLHRQGVAHRDLKPDNILHHQGLVQLADFGLAVFCGDCTSSSRDSSQDLCSLLSNATSTCSLYSDAQASSSSSLSRVHSSTGSLQDADLHCAPTSADSHSMQADSCSEPGPCPLELHTPLVSRRSSPELMDSAGGTPLYTAPEVLLAMFNSRPIHEAISPKNDIWALGIMVLEALTGEHPFTSQCGRGGNLLHSIAYHTRLPLPASVSPAARSFLGSCLQRDPALRPSADQLLTHAWLADKQEAAPAALTATAWAQPCAATAALPDPVGRENSLGRGGEGQGPWPLALPPLAVELGAAGAALLGCSPPDSPLEQWPPVKGCRGVAACCMQAPHAAGGQGSHAFMAWQGVGSSRGAASSECWEY